jgi:hypothetical protein
MGYRMARRTRSQDRKGNDMAEHKHKQGEMDISEQQKTFSNFMRWVVNIAIVCIAIVIFLAIFAR